MLVKLRFLVDIDLPCPRCGHNLYESLRRTLELGLAPVSDNWLTVKCDRCSRSVRGQLVVDERCALAGFSVALEHIARSPELPDLPQKVRSKISPYRWPDLERQRYG